MGHENGGPMIARLGFWLREDVRRSKISPRILALLGGGVLAAAPYCAIYFGIPSLRGTIWLKIVLGGLIVFGMFLVERGLRASSPQSLKIEMSE